MPWAMVNDEPYFLLQLPAPKRNAQDEMLWGIARGTVADNSGQDIRDVTHLEHMPESDIEDHRLTARREASEELGLSSSLLTSDALQDSGLQEYTNADGLTYPLHIFTIEVPFKPARQYAEQAKPEDTQALQWASLQQIGELVAENQMKAGYLPIAESVHQQLTATPQRQQSALQSR